MSSTSERVARLAAWSYRHTSVALALLDASGVIVECNPAFAAACHRRRTLVLGQSLLDALGQPPKSPLARALRSAAESGSARAVVSVPQHGSESGGDRQWRLDLTVEPESQLMTLMGSDLTDLRSLSAELETRTNRDRLTGLENRDALLDALVAALGTGQAVALFLVDVDRFTLINDTYGHKLGDSVLVLLGRRLVQIAGLRNTVARIGGDQFAVMVRRLASQSDVEEMARRLHDALTGDLTLDNTSLHLRVSIGYSATTDAGKGANDLFREADTALTRAAEVGGNITLEFRPEFHEAMEARMRTESDLRAALGTDQIDADVQGIFDCQTKELVAFEALARWRHPERGTVAPAGFIEVADRFGLLGGVMSGVLSRSLRSLRSWLLSAPGRSLAVNVAPSQLLDPRLFDAIVATVETCGVPPDRLTVEVTESQLVAEPSAVAMIGRIHDAGIGIAIDDFGAGASSLGYLWTLPVTILKIDRALVSSITSDAAASRTVAALVTLAHDLGLTVVAEGVEHEADHTALMETGCDRVQGYLLHRPCPLWETESIINRNRHVPLA